MHDIPTILRRKNLETQDHRTDRTTRPTGLQDHRTQDHRTDTKISTFLKLFDTEITGPPDYRTDFLGKQNIVMTRFFHFLSKLSENFIHPPTPRTPPPPRACEAGLQDFFRKVSGGPVTIKIVANFSVKKNINVAQS